MKNIYKVFISDWKRISKNVVAVVVVMGLIILPSLYAWFNILSNWDPYGEESTSRIKVAVASDDKGIVMDSLQFNMGDTIIEALESNNTIGWVFTDSTKDAIDGVYASGRRATRSAITPSATGPEDFSKKMVSFLTDSVTHPEIDYYTNQKKNAIAPKITDKAKTAVQQQVNSTFISTIAQTFVKAADGVDTSANHENMTSGQTVLDILLSKMQQLNTQLDSYDTILTALISVTDSASSAMNAAGQISPDMSKKIIAEQQKVDSLMKIASKGNILDSSVSSQLAAGLGQISQIMDSVINIYSKADGNIDSFASSISTAGVNLKDTKEMLGSLKTDLSSTIEKLNNIKNSGSYDMLLKVLGLDADSFGSFVASPVEIETEAIYPIATYGSAMAPFYTVLAIWVGGLILVAIIHVGVKPQKEHPDVKPYQAYFGRYITFFLIGQAQALLVTLGDLYYIGIQCVSPFKFWFAASVTSFVFTIFMYSLTVAMGNVGEALAVVIMVIQVAGAGGTFPIEVLPKVYQKIYEFLPFTHAMNAMRECVGGSYQLNYWKYLGYLCIYVIISLLIGLLFAIPCRKLNEKIEKSKHRSGVMI